MASKKVNGWKDLVISFRFFPEIGGAHAWLYEVYRRWFAEVDVLTHVPSNDEVVARDERAFDSLSHGSLCIFREISKYHDVSVLNPSFWRVLWQCWRRVHQLSHGGVVRIHALRACPEGFAAYIVKRFRRSRAQLITYAHGEEVLVAQTSRQLMYMTRLVYRWSDVIIANSESTRQAVQRLVSQAKVVVIHPGVEWSSYGRNQPAAEEFRTNVGWPVGTVVVLTLGRMEPRKNHAGVMRAVSHLRRQGLPIGYVCGGDGPERSSLCSLAASLDMQSWVAFPGSVDEDEKRRLFAAADIFAMPSIQVGSMIEGFGIVFIEAAAAGLPVVCGNNGGQPEAVRDGLTGIVVDGTDDAQIVSAIGGLVADTTRRDQMGVAAREWARLHDWQNVVAQTVEVVCGRV